MCVDKKAAAQSKGRRVMAFVLVQKPTLLRKRIIVVKDPQGTTGVMKNYQSEPPPPPSEDPPLPPPPLSHESLEPSEL